MSFYFMTAKPAVGFPGYWVTTSGHVWSHKSRGIGRPRSWARLSPGKDRGGYLHVGVCDDTGKRKTKVIHRIVLESFRGSGDGLECCHCNGVRHDNRLSNLRWGTTKENSADRVKHGTHNRGEQNRDAKLTEEDVRNIRSSNKRNAELGREFGVHRATISSIRRRRTWKHVQ